MLCPGGGGSFPWKNIWKARVPTQLVFFTWIAVLGNILMGDNLRNRGDSIGGQV